VIEALQPKSFHFRSWLAGQAMQNVQRQKLVPESGVVDFSQLDCTSCHHGLAANSWRQKSQAAILHIPEWPHIKLPGSEEPLNAVVQLQLVNQLLNNAEQEGRWDDGLQCFLMLRAVMGDLTKAARSATAEIADFKAAVEDLGNYLASDCFSSITSENRRPTPYDSPTGFAPGTFTERLEPVRMALQRLETYLASP